MWRSAISSALNDIATAACRRHRRPVDNDGRHIRLALAASLRVIREEFRGRMTLEFAEHLAAFYGGLCDDLDACQTPEERTAVLERTVARMRAANAAPDPTTQH